MRRPSSLSLAVSLALLVASPVLAQPCLDLDAHPRIEHWLDLPDPRGVVVDGTHAYVTDWGRLFVLRYEDVVEPTVVSELALPGYPSELALAADHLFVACGAADLVVLDVSDPASPQMVGSVDTSQDVYALDLDGDLLYLLSRYDLKIYDVAEPAAPQLLGTLTVPYYGFQIDVADGYAYLGTWSGDSMTVVDVRVPTDPVVAATLITGSTPHDVAVVGDRAYVAERQTGLLVVDVSDPHHPQPMGRVAMQEDACMRVVAPGGDLVYAGDGYGGTKVVDVRDPWRPKVIGCLGSALLSQAQCAYADGRLFVPVWERNLQIIDVSSPRLQPQVGTVLLEGVSIWDMKRHGDHLICAGYPGAFAVRADPVPDGEVIPLLDIGDMAMALEIHGDLVYLAGYYGGFHIIDIADLAAPVHLAGMDWQFDGVMDVVVRDDHAFLANYMAREFVIVDVSNPGDPFVRAAVPAPYASLSVEVAGDCAYIAAGGLHLYDISDLSLPTPLQVIDEDAYFQQLKLVGEMLYAADRESGSLRVFDVSTPAEPVEVSALPMLSNGRAQFELVGRRMYVSALYAGAQIIDLGRPAAPRHVGFLESGLQTYDTHAVAAGDGVVYLGGRAGALVALPAPCWADPDNDQGLPVMAAETGGEPTEERAVLAPNPANPGSRLSFSLDRAGRVRAALYDLAGRRVATLIDDDLPAGPHAVIWSGRTDAGLLASSGTYLLRLETGARIVTRKLTVVR